MAWWGARLCVARLLLWPLLAPQGARRRLLAAGITAVAATFVGSRAAVFTLLLVAGSAVVAIPRDGILQPPPPSSSPVCLGVAADSFGDALLLAYRIGVGRCFAPSQSLWFPRGMLCPRRRQEML